MNSTAVSNPAPVSWNVFAFEFGMSLGIKLVDYRVYVSSTLANNAWALSKMVVPRYMLVSVCMRVPIVAYSLKHCIVSPFICIFSREWELVSHGDFKLHFLMINEVDHLFICLFFTWWKAFSLDSVLYEKNFIILL